MRIFLSILAAVLLAGCGGASQTDEIQRSFIPDGQPALELVGVKHGSAWRVELYGRSVADLYQIGATIRYPEDSYDVLLVEAGGGLGDPSSSLFAGNRTGHGRIDFAYTKRFEGSGEYGDVRLASIKVRPADKFNIRDFSLDSSGNALVVRDSSKDILDLRVAGGAQ